MNRITKPYRVELPLTSLALGILAAYESRGTRRWKSNRAAT